MKVLVHHLDTVPPFPIDMASFWCTVFDTIACTVRCTIYHSLAPLRALNLYGALHNLEQKTSFGQEFSILLESVHNASQREFRKVDASPLTFVSCKAKRQHAFLTLSVGRGLNTCAISRSLFVLNARSSETHWLLCFGFRFEHCLMLAGVYLSRRTHSDEKLYYEGISWNVEPSRIGTYDCLQLQKCCNFSNLTIWFWVGTKVVKLPVLPQNFSWILWFKCAMRGKE